MSRGNTLPSLPRKILEEKLQPAFRDEVASLAYDTTLLVLSKLRQTADKPFDPVQFRKAFSNSMRAGFQRRGAVNEDGLRRLREYRGWGMHLTPEAPRSSIRALEDHSRTLGEFQERFAFQVSNSTAAVPPRAQ